MFIFHGGCHGCTQQDEKGTEYCVGCCYFDADWTLPNLSNKPPSPADRERERIKRKLGLGDSKNAQSNDPLTTAYNRLSQIFDQTESEHRKRGIGDSKDGESGDFISRLRQILDQI